MASEKKVEGSLISINNLRKQVRKEKQSYSRLYMRCEEDTSYRKEHKL